MENQPSKLGTLLGGIQSAAAKKDGSSETITIRQLPVNLMIQLLQALDDEPAIVELFCDKPKGWALELTLESFEHVVEEGEALNRDFFSRWVQRRLARQEKLMPGITDKITARALPSINTSPKSPSNAASP